MKGDNIMKRLLVVVDMQKDFIDGSLGTKEAQAIVPNVAEKIKEYQHAGSVVVFTFDTHYENYMETQEGKRLPVEHCIRETEGWELDEALRDFDGLPIEKSSFGSDVLASVIGDLYNVHSECVDDFYVELIGVCTDICVVSNALLIKSIEPEVRIVVDASCCAGTTPEKHKAALEVMKSCQIDVIGE